MTIDKNALAVTGRKVGRKLWFYTVCTVKVVWQIVWCLLKVTGKVCVTGVKIMVPLTIGAVWTFMGGGRR